ncbi:MAG: efflux RND transporter periplasmic adaptor subunit [Gammaproteobacteria bacterium]|nr:efflux RND transporter periplasmic adaptor subunit [Gammaproteobacteria bacterium]
MASGWQRACGSRWETSSHGSPARTPACTPGSRVRVRPSRSRRHSLSGSGNCLRRLWEKKRISNRRRSVTRPRSTASSSACSTRPKATLKTPIDGTILRLARDNDGRPQADGQQVRPGFRVAEIAPLDELVADIDLIGPELARVEVGLEARIRHYAFEESFEGEVIRLSPMLDPNKHTFRAEVAVANDEGLLRPGMFVEVIVVVEQRPDVVVVPRDAIANRAGKRVAFVLDGQRVSRRDLRLGLGDDDKVQVLDGVAEGDRVAVRGLETLIDGSSIRIVGT